MTTQLQSTPTLKGKDAQAVIHELENKPSSDQLRRVEDRRNFFSRIAKCGLR